ncbi:MAG: radical SAM protein [Candidatus Nanoarchaeia archaeon]|jgi:radical SAM superfamily enzyme YgiQ (UPF0313 family)
MVKNIKILFVNIVNTKNDNEIIYPPLGLAYLVSYAKKYLKNKNVIFKVISNNYEENIKQIKPDIIGLTCVSQNYEKAKNIAKFSKENSSALILIGGSHISLCPTSLDKNMDIGVLGEGEETFTKLIDLFIKKKKKILVEDLAKIQGIIYWNKNNIIFTKKRDFIMQLDKIPFPDRSLFKINPNDAYMFSSRGCPYNCIFCAASKLWKNIRFHSAEYVVNEIKELITKYKVKNIKFHDDLFIANKARIKEIARLMKKEKLTGKVEFDVSARANLITDELCILLKKMNVKSIFMGLESGSPKILKYLKGDSVSIQDNIRAIKTIKKHGFKCTGSFIIGTPLDTKETILDTLRFIKKVKLDNFDVFVLIPMPGTSMWDYAQKNGLITTNLEKFDWLSLDEDYKKSHKRNIHLAKNLTPKELYSLFLKFNFEKNKMVFFNRLKRVIRNPMRLINYIKRKLFKNNITFSKWT